MSILATISSMIGGTILLWIFSSSVLTFLKYIEKTHDMKEELKQILENLEESIMIISDSKADFINKRFLASFSKDIISHIPNDPPSTGNNLEIPSKLVRFKQFLRNACKNLKKYLLKECCTKKNGIIDKEDDPVVVPELMKVALFKIY